MIIIIMTLFRCQVLFSRSKAYKLGTLLYHSEMDGDLSRGRHLHTHINTNISPGVYGFNILIREDAKV